MRQVGVHLHADLGAGLDRVSETEPIGGTEAGLGVAADHLDVAERRVECLGTIGGSVGAAVVDHEDRRAGEHLPHRLDECLDVVGLVVGGYHHRDTHSPGRLSPGASVAGIPDRPTGRHVRQAPERDG